jgi:hypothetical protein
MADSSSSPQATAPRNCWSCVHDFTGAGKLHLCVVSRSEAFVAKNVSAWILALGSLDETWMPPKDADGCPGYEARS